MVKEERAKQYVCLALACHRGMDVAWGFCLVRSDDKTRRVFGRLFFRFLFASNFPFAMFYNDGM